MLRWIAALFLVLLGSGAASRDSRADWVATCACDSDGPGYSCHGRWPVWGESQAQLRQQCSSQTSGSGSLLDVTALSGEEQDVVDTEEPTAGPRSPNRE